MSPPPLAAPIARRLSISASAVGEEGLFSCVLPEELVVEIIADRVQVCIYWESPTLCLYNLYYLFTGLF